jgi:hypothetical protein
MLVPSGTRPWPITVLLAILLLALLGGCSTLPWQTVTDRHSPWTPAEISQKYQTDQQQRLLLPKNWQIQGILDIDHEEHGRRNRIIINSRQGNQLRLRVYGPFQQVAFDLLVDPDWLQLIRPDKRQVIRVPATSEGMFYLTGYSLNPGDLLQFFLGNSTPLANLPRPGNDGMESTTQQGERLLLDPIYGYIQERRPPPGSTNPYITRYYWSSTPKHPPPPLPIKLAITLPKEKMLLTFIFRKWQFSATETNNELLQIPESFSIVEPFNQH